MISRKFVLWTSLAALLWLGPAFAANAPNCTGISDVSGFDGATVGDFDGMLTTVRIVNGLERPLFLTSPPGDLNRLFIEEQVGRIRVMKDGVLLPTPFLAIEPMVACCMEQGLLGLAFHPDYANNGHFFIFYTDINATNDLVLDRYTRDATDPDIADPTTRVEVMRIPHPDWLAHNAGMLAFGPDGYLYVATGDGGFFCDPGPGIGNAQSLDSNLGKILRINVDTLPYTTTGNPFDGAVPGNDEIWALGLRNPYRFSFDRETDNLYIGDVGQSLYEEVNCADSSLPARNYGWVNIEGDVCPPAVCGGTPDCNPPDYVAPIHFYDQTVGALCAVIGGYVYRGCRMKDLHGTYFFADSCAPEVNSFRTDAACGFSSYLARSTDLAPIPGQSLDGISGFGEDERGELYVIDQGGEVFKILPVLNIMETSGIGARQLIASPGALGVEWSWEDLKFTSSHPVTEHKIYRALNDPTGPYSCMLSVPQANCATGDCGVDSTAGDPSPGQAYFYLVTSRDPTVALETRPGNQSDGTLRVVDTNSSCAF